MKILVRVKAGSRKNLVEKIDESHYKVWVTKLPEKGKANKVVISTLAKYFDLAPSRIIIIFGEKSNNKTIEVNDK